METQVELKAKRIWDLSRFQSLGLKLKLPGGRWRQYLGEAGPHQVFHKKNFAKKSFSQVFSQPATHGDVISANARHFRFFR